MAKREILAGATDQTIDVFVMDSSSTVGAGLSGLVFNSAGLACYYRKGATGSATALTLATQTVGGAHSDGGFVEIQATNMKGVYRLDLSDTVVATAGMVTLYLYGATNMAPVVAEIEVVSVNKFDSVRMGLTALPNAAADAAGGLPISDAGGLDLDAKIGALTFTVANKVDANATHISGDSIAADNLEALLDGTGGVTLVASAFTLTTPITANATQLSGDSAAADNAEAFFDGTGYAGTNNVIPTVTSVTNTVNAAVVSIGANVITAASINADAFTAAKFAADVSAEIADAVWDELIAGHLGAGSTGAALNAAGSAGDPWTTPLPGAYGAGTAGFIIGTNIDALISSRLAPTVSSRTLDVTATGAAGVDWGNVENPTTTVGLTNTTVGIVTLVNTLTTYTGNTPQTGDSFARLGAPAGVSVSADIAVIESQTDDIGVAGAGLTAIPWNAVWDAEVAAAVWDEASAGHVIAGSTGLALSRILTTSVAKTGTVDAGGGTATLFSTDVSEANGYWDDALFIFTSGNNIGQARPILLHDAGGTFSFDEAFKNAPAFGDAFIIMPRHVHTVTSVVDQVWDELAATHTTAGTLGKSVADILDDTGISGVAVSATAITQIWATALTEAYRATGATGTATQLLYEILQNLTEFTIVSTTKTVKKLDGSTTAKTYTLDSATTPTSITETT